MGSAANFLSAQWATSNFRPASNALLTLGDATHVWLDIHVSRYLIAYTNFVIKRNADTAWLGMAGGSDVAAANGAYFKLFGASSGATPGNLLVFTGSNANAHMVYQLGHASSLYRILNSSAAALFEIAHTGEVTINVGSLSFTGTSKGVCHSVNGAISSAGSTISDATQITTFKNILTTVSAGQGAKLFDGSPGIQVTVTNMGATGCLLYPSSGSDRIGANSVGVAINIPSGGTAIFDRISSTRWACILGTSP